MAFDLNNFVIDRIVRGIATAHKDVTELGLKAGDIMFSINQITNPSLSCTSESADAVDALSVPIATFYRAKQCEFSAENALFDMNLMATQVGSKKRVAGKDNVTIVTPCFQTINVIKKDGKIQLEKSLNHIPMENTTPKIYVLNGDGTIGEKVEIVSGTAYNKEIVVSGTTVTIGSSAKPYASGVTYKIGDYATIEVEEGSGKVTKTYKCVKSGVTTSPASSTTDWEVVTDESNLFAQGNQIFFMYEYEANGTENNGAVEVINSANNFPVGCKFIMEILGADVCDQTNLIYAYLIFPNAKLSPDFDWSIATDSTHPFSMRAMQELIYSSIAV